ncbi:PEGA domain-containing protein [Planctomicrobium sp. SH661]|uniref:PEGA domain-containing protein n=1 Tax=Planctomicrobium sp. SH661 TaxID=3448124 RepID=UPI003F5C2BA3
MRFTSITVWLTLCSVALSTGSGCVSRRMTIRTNPPGALVEVDGKRLGLSPVSTDFTYYGTHEFTISAPGYETLTVQQKVKTPFYQYVPIDFITNHFMPGRVTDRHDFTYTLQPRVVPIDEEQNLINRGRNFRSKSEVGGF